MKLSWTFRGNEKSLNTGLRFALKPVLPDTVRLWIAPTDRQILALTQI